jgi:hypothetical protein
MNNNDQYYHFEPKYGENFTWVGYKDLKTNKRPAKDCLHKQCEKCKGTGLTEQGTLCIHHISCDCPMCSPCHW